MGPGPVWRTPKFAFRVRGSCKLRCGAWAGDRRTHAQTDVLNERFIRNELWGLGPGKFFHPRIFFHTENLFTPFPDPSRAFCGGQLLYTTELASFGQLWPALARFSQAWPGLARFGRGIPIGLAPSKLRGIPMGPSYILGRRRYDLNCFSCFQS